MLAFAGNSLLCRLALKNASIDAASFTLIRLASGAFTLWLIMVGRKTTATGDWISAAALFVYAGAFSFAYVSLPAATGALILFGSVQFTMLGYGVATGDRLSTFQIIGIVIAVCSLVALLLPGLAAPSVTGTTLMMSAGIAWGVYSLRGRHLGESPGPHRCVRQRRIAQHSTVALRWLLSAPLSASRASDSLQRHPAAADLRCARSPSPR